MTKLGQGVRSWGTLPFRLYVVIFMRIRILDLHSEKADPDPGGRNDADPIQVHIRSNFENFPCFYRLLTSKFIYVL